MTNVKAKINYMTHTDIDLTFLLYILNTELF